MDDPGDLEDLPRVGTVLELAAGPRGLRVVRARARTRRTRTGGGAAASGCWRSTVDEQLVPYVRPQENGGHADVRWLELSDRPAAGSASTSTAPRQVSVDALDARPTSTRPPTTWSCSPRAETIVHLDAAHRGLGTASCGPDTLARSTSSAAGDLPLGVDAEPTRRAGP